MSDDIKGLVETSLNLGVLTLEKDKLTLQYAVRSAVGTAKEYLLKRIAALVEEFGGRVTNTGNYPAWEYRRDSVLRRVPSCCHRWCCRNGPLVLRQTSSMV